MVMKRLLITFFSCIIILFACSTSQDGKKKMPERVVPITINIEASNSRDLSFINLDYYRLKLLDGLDDFLNVDLDLVDLKENPEVVLNLEINNFILWPQDKRVSRRTLSRVIQVGTSSTGKPIYQTVNAIVDIVQVQRRTNGTFETKLSVNNDG